jgi:hypothetical protein
LSTALRRRPAEPTRRGLYRRFGPSNRPRSPASRFPQLNFFARRPSSPLAPLHDSSALSARLALSACRRLDTARPSLIHRTAHTAATHAHARASNVRALVRFLRAPRRAPCARRAPSRAAAPSLSIIFASFCIHSARLPHIARVCARRHDVCGELSPLALIASGIARARAARVGLCRVVWANS